MSRPALRIPRLSPVCPAYHRIMRFLEALATAFYRTFGITQPSDSMRRRAAWFLLGLITLIGVAVSTTLIMVFHSL